VRRKRIHGHKRRKSSPVKSWGMNVGMANMTKVLQKRMQEAKEKRAEEDDNADTAKEGAQKAEKEQITPHSHGRDGNIRAGEQSQSKGGLVGMIGGQHEAREEEEKMKGKLGKGPRENPGVGNWGSKIGGW
tara:strand:+ start:339 stop:731 length:393 start_codon:yes stop_codon:yes gene_type:complete